MFARCQKFWRLIWLSFDVTLVIFTYFTSMNPDRSHAPSHFSKMIRSNQRGLGTNLIQFDKIKKYINVTSNESQTNLQNF